MMDPGTAAKTPRSGSGCGTALGIGLILSGGLFLAANLAGTQLVLLVFELLPLAAVWWPLLLVVWGLSKIVSRLWKGRTRFGALEVFLLLLLILGGTGLTLAKRVIESQGLELRLLEMSRLAARGMADFPQHVFVTERTISLPGDGPVDVVISVPAGNVLVEAAPSAPSGPDDATSQEAAAESLPPGIAKEGRVTLSKRVWAADREQAAARAASVRLVAGPFDAESGRIPVGVEDSGESDVALEIRVVLPPGVNVSAFSGEGVVRIQGPFGDVEARTSEGPLDVRGARGAVSLRARDGAVWASEIKGELQIRGRRAVVEVESVTGPVTVESEGAPVWISGAGSSVRVRGRDAPVEVALATGPVEVETRISPITLDRIESSATVRSEFGPILATSVGGPLRIVTESASVEVREAGSTVEISGAGGAFVLANTAGSVTVSSGRGEVRASNLLGPASFSGRAGAITVREFAQALSVDGGDALVDVASDALNGDVSLTTDRGDIRLALPAAGSFALSAEAEGGEVESDFALERTDRDGRSRWTGSAGSASRRVTISTDHGEVSVRARRSPAREGNPQEGNPQEGNPQEGNR